MSGSMDLEFFRYSFQLQLTHFLLVRGRITAQTDEQYRKAGLKIAWMAGLQFTAFLGGPKYAVVTEGQWL